MENKLRNIIGREEFDYPSLMSALSGYANPRSKVTSLLRKGVIVRVKKGLYVFGDDFRRRPFSRELLGNLIYGPSFVSLDYALSYHGLIPERVAAVTSVTTKREKRFETPVGLFVYRRTPKASFHLGMTRVAQNDFAFLIASPERALADKLRDDRGISAGSLHALAAYLFDGLRLDREGFLALDPELLTMIAKALGSRKVELCSRLLQRMRTAG
jgi:hypothetical protein